MNQNSRQWIKAVVTLLSLLALALLLPNAPVDPWNLLNLKKTATMIFALAFIQAVGIFLNRFLGAKLGGLLIGFLGGLISSTATTASLAKQSQRSSTSRVETLTFLAATAAMFLEGATLTLIGTNDTHPLLLVIFSGPLLVTGLLIIWQSRRIDGHAVEVPEATFKISPILKLSGLILAILIFSKVLQNIFGQSGLFILTFLVSLFEIHGSMIANIQLHDSGAFNLEVLGNLLAISILASYLSKLFLIFTFGSQTLKMRSAKQSSLLFGALVLSWISFRLLVQ